MKKLLFISHPFQGKQSNIKLINAFIDEFPRSVTECRTLGNYVPFVPWLPLADNYDDNSIADRKDAEDLIYQSLDASDAAYFAADRWGWTPGMWKEYHYALDIGLKTYEPLPFDLCMEGFVNGEWGVYLDNSDDTLSFLKWAGDRSSIAQFGMDDVYIYQHLGNKMWEDVPLYPVHEVVKRLNIKSVSPPKI